MALKDLASDLSAYKGQTTPTSIDSQIKEGVDFFPNDDASGFTPKTNLESLYNQVREGNVAQTWPEAAPTNDKTRQAFGQQGEYDVPDNVGRAVPSFLLNTDTLLGVRVQPQLLSPFLETPIADAVSAFNEDPFSVTLGTKSNPIRGDKRFNDRTYYIDGRQPAGLNGDFPFIPNAHKIAVENTDPNKTFDVTTMDDTVYGGYNLPTQKSSAGNATIKIINHKRRGVFDHMVNTFFENQPIPVNQQPNTVFNPTYDRYFSENNGKSIHISPAGELKAGLRYGAVHQSTSIGANEEVIQNLPQFKIFNNGQGFVDSLSPIHTTEVTLGDRYSAYSNYPDASLTPSNLIVGNETILAKWPDRASTNLLSPFPSTGYDIGTEITSNINDFFEKKSGVEKSGYDDLFEFKKGQFQNVPDGLNSNNKFGTKSYRSVANQGPFAGNDRHPLILREVGNNWGSDRFEAGSIGEIVGGLITSGAPGLTGLIDRNVTDKLRIAKFLISPQGVSFAAKQFAMQGLNPTIESKIWNPLSLFGVVGMSDFAESIGNIVSGDVGFDDIPTALKGMVKAAASIAFPIGHVDRHLGGSFKRYEDLIKNNSALGSPITVVIEGLNSRGENYGRLAAAAVTFGKTPKEVKIPPSNTGIGFLDNYIDKKVEKAVDSLSDAQLVPTFTMMNPNKYSFPISSAPKSIEEGVPSFTGTVDLALADIKKAQKGLDSRKSNDGISRGGTFNPESHIRSDTKTHFTLPYNRLNIENSYEADEDSKLTSIKTKLEGFDENTKYLEKVRNKYHEILKKSGDVTNNVATVREVDGFERLGIVKGNTTSNNVDRVNITPIVDGDPLDGGLPDIITKNPDFIKFRFRDVINKKFIVFRAILSGINDTVTPEYNPIEYIGRPDKLYTYKGVDRDISFNFKVYPKTKQELPVLMEKMNYLIGLCYPSYTDRERMVAPYTELTMGDMFVDAPGVLTSVAVTVEDESTWEIEEGLQYPHFISAQCTFKYIGKYTPVSLGKFYDISWLTDNRQNNADGSQGKPVGTYTENPAIKSKSNTIQNSSNMPYRQFKYDYRWINTITGNNVEDGRPTSQESTTD